MARTINGNLIGKAARTHDQEDLIRTPQDVRIGRKKNDLRAIMGEEEFAKFYVLTSFSGDALEKEIDDMYNLVRAEKAGIDVDGFLLLMAVLDTPAEPFVDDWAADPWTMEEIASEEMNHYPESGLQ